MPDHFNGRRIRHYYQETGVECADMPSLDWICTAISALSLPTRELPLDALNTLNARIATVPSGRRRALLPARDDVLFYLKSVCDWQLPEKKDADYEDRAMQWMLSILKHSHSAGQLHTLYTQQRQTFTQERWQDIGWVLLVMNLDVAPLPLSYWVKVLSEPSSIAFFEGQFTLKVPHPKPIAVYDRPEHPSFTRYPLSLFAYRVLSDFYRSLPSDSVSLSTQYLGQQLNRWCEHAPYYLPSQGVAQWHQTFLCVWHYRDNVPAPLLRDLSDPMRHVATLSSIRTATPTVADSNLFFQPPNAGQKQNRDPAQPCASTRLIWPHTQLIKYYRGKRVQKPSPPHYLEGNLLPWLFYTRTLSLFEDGGVQKDRLPAASIERYTNFYKRLSPLSLQEALSPDSLHAWGHEQFKRLNGTSNTIHLYTFLQHMAHQALTDHLDLSQFEKPTLPALVDPCRLQVGQIHQTIDTLLSCARGDPLQRLFASVAVLLGFYGALRRGEVLRLRLCDIAPCTVDEQRFDLHITTTDEGGPKGGKHRLVHAYFCAPGAKLLRILLKLKDQCPPDAPLLGWLNERYSQREQRYLYPVTQVLKAHFGKGVRFHHLRHSGADLLLMQGLHLAHQCPNRYLDDGVCDHDTRVMLGQEVCQARFYFWIEGNPFDWFNDGVLLDVIGKELGHTYYATTRKHYVHGMERILPLLRSPSLTTDRAMLRYLLDIPVGSNDVARVLDTLDPEYALLEPLEKKQYQPALRDAQLLSRLLNASSLEASQSSCSQRAKKAGSQGACTQPPPSKHEPNAFYHLWAKGVPSTFNDTSLGRFRLLNRHTLANSKVAPFDFSRLSQQWHALNHLSHLQLTKEDKKALTLLGPVRVTLSHDTPATVVLSWTCRCNKKTQSAYQRLFHEGPFQRCPATLTLHQNRKTLKSGKFELVEAAFKRASDRLLREIIDPGDTKLVIMLTTPILAQGLIAPMSDYFSSLIDSN
ncbi:site-specific integrase [Vibrio mediterranei]|uniref:site-specific integrase n=1 Tax=Vibrio mediterranei TaxID=689 RepID=UPI004067F94C